MKSRVALLAVGLVLSLAGAGKMLFGIALQGETALRLTSELGSQLAKWLFLILSGVELALGLHLVLGLWLRTTAVIALALLVTFLAVSIIDSAAGSGVHHTCGCFGALSIWEKPVGGNAVFHILLNASLASLCFLGAVGVYRRA